MKLIYFTASYPYGIGEVWKSNELNLMAPEFAEITVVPYSYGDNFDKPKTLPAGIKLKGPLFRSAGVPLHKTDIFRILFHRKAFSFLKEFFSKKVYRNRKHLISWMGATMTGIRLLAHPVIKEIIASGDRQTILCFFWGRGACEFLPFTDTSRFGKVFVRMHRYDLFEQVNDGYIPYRKALLEKITMAAPSSEAGKVHLRELYPEFASRIELFRLGSLWNGRRGVRSADAVLRIVSCSYLSPVKRVHLMIESLRYVDFPVIWRHVGDGPLRGEMEELIRKYGLEDKFIIEGMVDTGRLLDYYLQHSFDLFVNVSSSEGVPMSIMEVLSLGIPVLATHVGGNGEIVDDTVGRRLPAELSPEELAGALKEYYQLQPAEKDQLRENAHERFIRQWDVVRITREVTEYLKSGNQPGL